MYIYKYIFTYIHIFVCGVIVTLVVPCSGAKSVSRGPLSGAGIVLHEQAHERHYGTILHPIPPGGREILHPIPTKRKILHPISPKKRKTLHQIPPKETDTTPYPTEEHLKLAAPALRSLLPCGK